MQGQGKRFAVPVICLLLLLLPACGQQSASPEQTRQTPALVIHTAKPAESEPSQTAETTEAPEELEETTEETSEETADNGNPDGDGDGDGGEESEAALGDTPDDIFPVASGPAVITVLSPVASGTLTKQSDQAVIDYSHTEDG